MMEAKTIVIVVMVAIIVAGLIFLPFSQQEKVIGKGG